MCELSPSLVAVHGTYRSLFESFFEGHDVELVDFAIHEGDAPLSIDDCDGWVISGSPASVYDGDEWIRTGEEIVRSLVAAERPLLGVCFGHQLMAQALGGEVRRAAVGWGAGAHEYDVIDQPHSGAPLPDRLRILAMHQDQVVTPPPDGDRWLTSEFCPNAGFRYGERAWSIQPHPEFTPGLVEQLCHERELRLGADVAAAAIASLDAALDGQLVARAAIAVHADR